MSDFRFELDKKGVRELLRSAEARSVCESYADAALGRLGAGYGKNTRTGKNRVNVEVAAETRAAANENSKGNTILKAVRG